MVQPINYILPNSDQMAQTLAGYGAGLNAVGARQDMAQRKAQEERAAELHPLALAGAELGIAGQQLGLEQTQQTMDIRAAQEARNAAAAEKADYEDSRKITFQFDMAELARNPDATFEDYFAVAGKYPEFGSGVMETFDTLDDNRRRGTAEMLGQIAVALRNDNADLAIQLGEEYATAAENSGDTDAAQTARAMVELARVSPQAALASLGVTLVGLDEDIAKQALGESLSGSGRKVSRSILFQNGTSQTIFNDGSVEVKDPQGNVVTGEAAQDILAEANDYETQVQSERAGGRTLASLEAETEGGGSAAAATELGKLQAKFVENSEDQLGKLSSSINNIQTAIQALDEGGKSGPFQRYLPNITEASATLRNAMDRMGLDVIGSVTFGALSEGELRLAMETAVPRNLDEAGLRSWLEEKLDAQRKVRIAIMEQARFLSDPNNSINDWYDQLGVERDVTATPTSGLPSYLEDLD